MEHPVTGVFTQSGLGQEATCSRGEKGFKSAVHVRPIQKCDRERQRRHRHVQRCSHGQCALRPSAAVCTDFNVERFAKIYVSKMGVDSEKMMKRLWGDNHFTPRRKLGRTASGQRAVTNRCSAPSVNSSWHPSPS